MEQEKRAIIKSSLLVSDGITHGVSTKPMGNMSFGRDYDGTAVKNLKNFLELLDIQADKDTILFLNLTHSANVALVKKVEGRNGRVVLSQNSPEIVRLAKFQGINPPSDYVSRPEEGIDACISKSPGLLLAILPADCAPIFLYDPVTSYYAIAHAGVLGAFSNIVPRTIECMREWVEVDPHNLHCYIGPCITSKIYHLESSGLWKTVLHDKVSLEQARSFDLKDYLANQLLTLGLKKENIELSKACTGSDSDLFFSNYSVKTNIEKNKQGRIISCIGRAEI